MRWNFNHTFVMNKISWERVFLDFTIEEYINETFSDKFQFAFMFVENDEEQITNGQEVEEELIFILPEKSMSIETGIMEYQFSINMSAIQNRSFLENGMWRFCVINNEQVYPVSVDYACAHQADQLGRIFKYGENKYAYNVSFTIKAIDDHRVEFILNSYFVIVNKNWKKRKYVQEAVTFTGKFRRVYMYAVIIMIRCFYFVFSHLLPKKGDKVLFMTETKDYLWGNLKYVYDRMMERGLDQQFKITCSCRKAVGEKNSVISWIKTVWLIAKSDYVFVDDYAPVLGFFKLNKNTKLIQLWHAGVGFKSVGYSRFGKEGSPFPMRSCHKQYTYAITGAENLRKVYEEVFGIERDAILPLGMARLDDFLDEKVILKTREKLYQQYPELKQKRVILFAPTFRGTGQQDAYYDYDKLDFKKLYDYCGMDTVILFKMHPFVKEKIPIPVQYGDRLYDFSSYPNINELYYITDLLITDYSSDYYEYALLGKPMLFYTYDREFYELTRGVHRDVKENAPGKVCDNFEELINALQNDDYEYDKTERFVKKQFKNFDGHASDRIIDEVLLQN